VNEKKKDGGYLFQFIPDTFNYLTKIKKVKYDGINLKTDYLINIIHELILKYYFHKDDIVDKEIKFNMWSTLMRVKYGAHYNYYINYLMDKGFVIMVSDYFKNKKARTYKLNTIGLLNIKRVRVYDNTLIKKNSKDYLKKNYLTFNNSPIPFEIRDKLINDLYHININVEQSMKLIEDQRFKRDISYNKYWKNMVSIENIGIQNMFFKFDEYGRMHTNFTVLKREIRKNYLKIDGEDIVEVDINNSQPLFLAVLMKNELPTSKLFNPEFNRYFDLVKNGLIYEELMLKCDILDRNEAKIMMYKVLFGINGDTQKYNRMFYELFPNVYKFIKEYKSINDSYKSLSHALQNLESKFIFNTVIKHIIKLYPDIRLFTVHDSICCQLKYKEQLKEIFDYYQRKLLIEDF